MGDIPLRSVGATRLPEKPLETHVEHTAYRRQLRALIRRNTVTAARNIPYMTACPLGIGEVWGVVPRPTVRLSATLIRKQLPCRVKGNLFASKGDPKPGAYKVITLIRPYTRAVSSAANASPLGRQIVGDGNVTVRAGKGLAEILRRRTDLGRADPPSDKASASDPRPSG